jgi:SAM-dependent methyltransferase
VLDVGCGQGFFSKLLVDEGMKVEGVDASQEGINSAQRYCAKATFFVGDAFGVARERAPFQAVFCRAFSPYNTSDLARQRATTDRLLEVLIPGGILIWLYNSRLRPAEGQSWRQHSLTEAQHQFEPYNASVFVSLRVETSFVGLGRWQTALNEFLVKHSPLGGELVVLVKKPGG